jgi:hypothetical protein
MIPDAEKAEIQYVRLIVQSLRACECPACAGAKKPGMSFCRSCYADLPVNMARALYKRVGQGYEEAFDHAVRKLAAQGIRHPRVDYTRSAA